MPEQGERVCADGHTAQAGSGCVVCKLEMPGRRGKPQDGIWPLGMRDILQGERMMRLTETASLPTHLKAGALPGEMGCSCSRWPRGPSRWAVGTGRKPEGDPLPS